WTIGFGHTGHDVGPHTVWTLAQCEAAFDADIAARGAQLLSLLGGKPTTQNQFDAMTSWLYNEGFGHVAGSTLLALHKAGYFGTFAPKTDKGTGAAGEFPKWNKANGKIEPGLVI